MVGYKVGRFLAALASLATFAQPAYASQQGQTDLMIRAYRFYRAEGNLTRVTAYVEVPYSLLSPDQPGPAGMLRYRVAVRVRDSAGTELYQTTWTNAAHPLTAGKEKATSLEHLQFNLAPGRFQLTVDVTDSLSGRSTEASAWLDGYATRPAASDLVLAPQMRLATASDTMPHFGEEVWGRTLITVAPRLRLTPVRSQLYYLVEAYADQGSKGTMTAQVRDSAGKTMLQTRPSPISIDSGGSVLRGRLDMKGLPSGRYDLVVTLSVNGQAEERKDSFVMADFDQTMAEEERRIAALKETDEGYFGLMGGEELDAARAPLGLLADATTLQVYSQEMTIQARRNFLVQFWRDRDPTPGTPLNEARIGFYERISYANKNYGETGRNGPPGWRTDRGRIYIKQGLPTEVLDGRAVGSAPPYQVWRYAQGKDRYYVFLDRTGFNSYKLYFSNDTRENNTPGFREMVGTQALQEISRFLGVDLFAGNPSSSVSPRRDTGSLAATVGTFLINVGMTLGYDT